MRDWIIAFTIVFICAWIGFLGMMWALAIYKPEALKVATAYCKHKGLVGDQCKEWVKEEMERYYGY